MRKREPIIVLFLIIGIIILIGFGPAILEAQSKGKKPPPPKKRPDLAIDKVALNKECFIVFTVVNRGNAGVPEYAYRKSPYKGNKPCEITMVYQGQKKSYFLVDVDPSKKLKNPKSAISFKTPIKLDVKANVRVIADSTNAVKESKEIRNDRTEILIPKCIKTMELIKLPDLTVPKIGLDKQCHVIFTIQNKGTAAVPKYAYAKSPVKGEKPCKITMVIGRKKHSFFLVEVDPTARLKNPSSHVTFKTPIKLSKKSNVKVAADSTKAISELNETNNDKERTLTPKCLTISPPLTSKSGKKRKKKGTAKSVDEGIQFLSPVAGAAFLPGDRMTVNFRFRSDIAPIPISEIQLLNGSTPVYTVPAGDIPPPSRNMSVGFQIPAGVPATLNYSVLVRANDTIWGQSDNFRIGVVILGTMQTFAPHGLRVIVEGNPSIVNLGEKITVRMEITNPEDPGFMAPSAYQSGYGFNIFVHSKYRGRDQMGLWYMPGWRILSRSEDYKTLRVELTIGESWDEGDDFVVTFNHTAAVYGDSSPFSIRPGGVSEGSLNITDPTSDSILRVGQSHDIQFTLYDRDSDIGLYFLVELLKYRSLLAPAGRGKEVRKPTIVHSQTIAPICNTVTGGMRCRISYIPPEGTNSNLYRASGMGKNYKIRITASERGERPIATGYSDKFALLDTSNAMDIGVESISVNESGQLQVRYRVLCDEPFSARIPFTVEFPYNGVSHEVPVMVTSGSEYVYANLGHIRDLKPRSEDGPQLTCRVTANKNGEFFERRDDNNQGEDRVPIVAKYIYFNFRGSDYGGDRFYYHDYQRGFCCECNGGYRMTNAGYQTITGEVEIHQTGNWDTGGGSGTLSPPYHDNHLVTWDINIAPGDSSGLSMIQRSVLTGLRWTSSNLVFTFRGEIADFISPNPAVKALRHRDGT